MKKPDADKSDATSIAQYSIWQILGIWASAAIPMGLLAWIIFPAFVSRVNIEPAIFLWILMIAGLIWQMAVSAILLYREHGTLRPSAVRRRTWRQQPRSPKTGQPKSALWLWLIPALVLYALLALVIGSVIQRAWTSLLPFFTAPTGYELQELTKTPEKWVGAWYLIGLMLVHIVGNYLYGEEFLFRSILLPKMNGVFGKWDWLANAVLFGIYHVHKPWVIPSAILAGIIFAYPSRRFRCTWFGLIIHGADGIFLMFIILSLVLGIA
jgi:hypothetical protein